MEASTTTLLNANQAVAQIAYKINESCIIYPITPASEMSELVEKWSAEEQANLFGNVPTVVEMQSEAGVAGAMHGSLQAGASTTTFTASQGLLLMMPNMFRIAGELTPNVIHVATRSIATHALSVFGDHSDIMAARSTGYAFLGAASVQEAMDFALIAQAASFSSSIPFVHFFDGFRTSHEYSTIQPIEDEVIRAMMDQEDLLRFHENRLTPDKPVLRGTAQGPDVFFQSREAINIHYQNCADIVAEKMDLFGQLTGRYYSPFEYVGDPSADQVVIAMGSACETIEQVVRYLNQEGEKTGLIKVHLFRPFSAIQLLKCLPLNCKRIAVLDRTKEPGSSGEPLYLDVLSALEKAPSFRQDKPAVVGGRYGLASKDFTPSMAMAVFEELKNSHPKNNFTVGIDDDVTQLSLRVSRNIPKITNGFEMIICAEKNESGTEIFRILLDELKKKNIGYIQAYTECNYKKSKSYSKSHLRIDKDPIKAPYLVQAADLIVCTDLECLEQADLLEKLKPEGSLLIAGKFDALDISSRMLDQQLEIIRQKNIKIHLLDQSYGHSEVPNYLTALLNLDFKSQDLSLLNDISQLINLTDLPNHPTDLQSSLIYDSDDLIAQLVSGKGDNLPVSSFPVDGTYRTNTAGLSKAKNSPYLPVWDMNACTQCGACSLACPLAAIRAKLIDKETLDRAPQGFSYAETGILKEQHVDLVYSIQVNPDQCDGCTQCIEACPEDALHMESTKTIIENRREDWNYFDAIPYLDPVLLDQNNISHLALRQPLFEYPDGDQGCGQAPYLKLLSQLFGDRLMVANATGSSSIFGGALPTTPWAQNSEGRGPAWSNSLFEDNAEFGLGFRLAADQKEKEARKLLNQLSWIPQEFEIEKILTAQQKDENGIREQRERVKVLKEWLQAKSDPGAIQLLQSLDSLVRKSSWIIGGDGWAYDIGFGGIDHVVSTGRNVNILVLDNEVYDNTGGQMSKSTPMGASVKFAHKGKKQKKKDLGQMLMTYEDVYVGSVSLGADPAHTLQTFLEAESYDGPSVIIAYCHSKAHGIDITRPAAIHKSVVESGRWLLYRYDPRRIVKDLNPLQLDSLPPDLPLIESLKLEKRYSNLTDSDNPEVRFQLATMKEFINRRYSKFEMMAQNTSMIPV